MLFTVGLLLLLAPFPSFQATTSLKRDPAGSDVSKANAVLTHSKPKTAAALNKQTRSALKPNAVNLTVLSAASINQKPSAVDATLAAKSKLNPAVIQTTPSPAVKATTSSGPTTIKDKPTGPVNRTAEVKSLSASDVKNSKDKPGSSRAQTLLSTPAKAVKAISAADDKDKLTVNQTIGPKVQSSSSKTIKTKLSPLVNQTASAKSPSGNGARDSKDKPAPTGASDVQLPTKTASVSGVIATKEKHQPVANETVSGKSHSDSDMKPGKAKPAPTGSPTKPASAGVAKGIKDKVQPSTNETVSDGESKDKAAPTGDSDVQANQAPTNSLSASGAKATKEKLLPVLSRPVSGKSHSVSEEKPSKDKPAPTAAPDVQSTHTKPPSAGVVKSVKHTTQPSSNETVSGNSPSASATKDSKDKPATTGAPDVQSTHTKPPSAGVVKSVKDKAQPSTNETVKSAGDSKDKPAPTAAPDVQSTQPSKKPIPTSGPRAAAVGKSPSGTQVKPNTEKPAPTGAPDDQSTSAKPASASPKVDKLNQKSAAHVNQTNVENNSDNAPGSSAPVKANHNTVAKPPTATKDSSAPTQPIRVVINNGCDSSDAKQQELELQPGAPLVMTHKISLSPGGCTGVCESEMAALTQRVARLEREMSLLKDKCPCSGKCPDDCSGKGKCEKGKCVCHGGLVGPDCKDGKHKTKETAGTRQDNVSKNGKEGSSTTTKTQNKLNELKDEPHSNHTQGDERKPRNPDNTGTGTAGNVTQSPGQSKGTKAANVQTGGLGSVKAVNISSNSFTLTWLAPKGMFKNFTVIRTESRLEGDDDQEHHTARAKNSSEASVQTEGTKSAASGGKADTKRISIVVPGSVRSVEFSNLRVNTRYALQIYGTGAEKRSKTHEATAVTGPESATDLVLSNVTESSLTVSWSKPKSTYSGFRVTYTSAAGESHSVPVGPQQSHVVLSKLSAGSTYTVSVTATLGRAQSDALTAVMTTVPAPPTHLEVVSVTENRAVLQWTPSLGTVDRFVITYESSKTPNVTVTVTVSGGSVAHQLRGLQRGTVYTVRVLSQKGSRKSTAASTTFTTASVVKASEVGPRSAVIAWKAPAVVYHSYRMTYQVAGQEKKEVILEPTATEHKLTGLLPISHYEVLVQGEREGRYTSLFTADFITGKLRFPFPTECSQELLNGALQSGEVDIYPQGKEGQAVRVYCDMETDGGGWTVFQRRMNGKIDFYRNWSDYRAGFGNLSEEFWLGNDLLRNLTSVGPVSLRVDMQSGNDTAYAHYANFSVDSEKRHYVLTVSGYTGTAGDSMKYHNGRPFSTWDKDPHSLGIHCAKAYSGGWWYKNCYKTNLNGLYGANSNNQGIVWIDWKGKDFSIPFTEMKFRPSAFSPATHG